MPNPDPDLQLVTVFESDNLVAFNMAKAMLEQEGIEYAAAEEALTGYGFSPMLNPVCRIEVAEKAKARAMELIQGLSSPGDSEVAEP